MDEPAANDIGRLCPATGHATIAVRIAARNRIVNALLWVLAVVLIVVGVAGTVLPALPGAILVFAGIALAAWIDHFTRIPAWLLVVFGLLTGLAWTVDYAAAALGAKRAGASRLAIIGAALGTVAGVLGGLWGLLFMPLVGATVGEYIAQRDLRRAGHVGLSTWVGLVVGTAAKIAIVFAMVGLFAFALVV
jgi:uncharacterized protein YqgC (DUF456 family)